MNEFRLCVAPLFVAATATAWLVSFKLTGIGLVHQSPYWLESLAMADLPWLGRLGSYAAVSSLPEGGNHP
jgi:hypothetical protein